MVQEARQPCAIHENVVIRSRLPWRCAVSILAEEGLNKCNACLQRQLALLAAGAVYVSPLSVLDDIVGY